MNRRDFLAASTVAAAVPALFAGSARAAEQRSSTPLKVLVPAGSAENIAAWKAVAPSLELIPCKDQKEALEQVRGADASCGFISEELIRAGKSLKWIQHMSAGVENLVSIPELADSGIVLTNMQRAYAPEIADQVFGYLLAFTRGLAHFVRVQPEQKWPKNQKDVVLDELPGKTMLIIGLGGIGSEVARRAAGFDLRVLATDPKVIERPLSVSELYRPESLEKLLPQADIVVSAVPLTQITRKMLGEKELGLMKPGVVFINVSRGGIVDTDALVSALDKGHVSAAGLDVTDPEPLPSGHPLWSRNTIITPHNANQSPGAAKRRNIIITENLRRFASGEQLINIVDKKAGY